MLQNAETQQCIFNSMLRTALVAGLSISKFILHASAGDIIWGAGLVTAQLWPSFPPSLAFFSPAPTLQGPLDMKTLCVRPGLQNQIASETSFCMPLSLPTQNLNTEPRTFLLWAILCLIFSLSAPMGLGAQHCCFPLGSLFCSRGPWE